MNRKNLIVSLILLTIVILGTLNLSEIASAQFSNLDKIGQQAGLPEFMSRGTALTGDQGINKLEATILTLVDLLKYLIYGLAVFFAFFQGFKLVIAGKDIDSYLEPAKNNAKYSLMAILVVFLADTLIRKVFFPNAGEIFDTMCDTSINPSCTGTGIAIYGTAGIQQIRGLYNTMEFIAGALAVLVIVMSGIGYALSAGNEETMKKNQSRILWACAGLLLIGIAEFVVKDVLFPEVGTVAPNIGKGLLLVKKFTNFMAGFVTTISFGLMIYAGFLYVSGAANEENIGKAKKAIMAGVVGILLSLAAFGLVSTLIKTESGAPIVTPVGQAPATLDNVALPTK